MARDYDRDRLLHLSHSLQAGVHHTGRVLPALRGPARGWEACPTGYAHQARGGVGQGPVGCGGVGRGEVGRGGVGPLVVHT